MTILQNKEPNQHIKDIKILSGEDRIGKYRDNGEPQAVVHLYDETIGSEWGLVISSHKGNVFVDTFQGPYPLNLSSITPENLEFDL